MQIKHLHVLILYLSFMSLNVAQSQVGEFTAGVFVNTNGMQIEGDNEILWQSSDGKVWGGGGLSAGANVHTFLNKKHYLVFELRYVQKGSVYEMINDFGMPSLDLLRLNYVETPVMFGFVSNKRKKQYRFELGLAYAKMFKSKLKIQNFAKQTLNSNADYFKDYDLSLVGQLKLPVFEKKLKQLTFGVRCSYSLVLVHDYYKLKHFIYGLQLDYTFN